MEKCIRFLRRTKDVLSKDYSVHDIKAWLTGKASTLPMAMPQSASGSTVHRDVKELPQVMRALVLRHRIALTFITCITGFFILSVFWLMPLSTQWQAALELRPVQMAQLQQLVKLANGSTPQSANTAVAFAALDDAEMQKLRAVLIARDIKPNVFRLTTDNPPHIELQANEVLFSAWIELLDELRQVWRLYPETVNAVASATPGLVQISSTLKQAQPANNATGRAP
jgi:hypothetical protein